MSDAVRRAVGLLASGRFEGHVRPWHVAALRREAASLGEVSAAVAVHLDGDELVAELTPSGRRIGLRWSGYEWRLVSFVAPGDTTLPPETTRDVPLLGDGPDGVLATLGIDRPPGVTLRWVDTELGQGETETRHGYEWTDGTRSILAEEIRNEIFDGATPYTIYVRGVVVDGDHGCILSGSGDSATLIEG